MSYDNIYYLVGLLLLVRIELLCRSLRQRFKNLGSLNEEVLCTDSTALCIIKKLSEHCGCYEHCSECSTEQNIITQVFYNIQV
jgi:hypothetical protein